MKKIIQLKNLNGINRNFEFVSKKKIINIQLIKKIYNIT